MGITITNGSLEEALFVLEKLPEFDALKPKTHYQQILESDTAQILIARIKNEPIGCKLGYDRFKDGSFYSWLGGVIPEYRQMGIAKVLAQSQEEWAHNNGYTAIRFKTQNRHKAMLGFAIKNGFSIYNVKPKGELDHYRIELIKQL